MSKLDERVGKYINDLRSKCGMEPDPDLVRKIARSLGPSIYRDDAETVSASDPTEIERVKKNFLMRKLGLGESDDLNGAIDKAMETYGRSERRKYRAVVYYVLTKHFGKEAVFA